MKAIEWIVIAGVAVLVLAAVVRAYRRWQTRRMAEIVMAHSVGFLFELARVDGSENATECAAIADHAVTVGMQLTGKPAGHLDSAWLSNIIWRVQHSPMTSSAKEDFLTYLCRSPAMAHQFLDLYCEFAVCDGAVNEAERQWIEAVGVLTGFEPQWSADAAADRRPAAKQPLAIR